MFMMNDPETETDATEGRPTGAVWTAAVGRRQRGRNERRLQLSGGAERAGIQVRQDDTTASKTATLVEALYEHTKKSLDRGIDTLQLRGVYRRSEELICYAREPDIRLRTLTAGRETRGRLPPAGKLNALNAATNSSLTQTRRGRAWQPSFPPLPSLQST